MPDLRNFRIRMSAITLMVMISCFHGMAQDPVFSRLTEEEGLPSDYVYDILVADNGIMWFATDNGVCQYNGREFTSYNVTEGLAANVILKLYQDMTGRIWFLSNNGLLSYFEDGNVRAYEFNGVISRYLRDSFFHKMYVDSSGTIKLSPRRGGIYTIDPQGRLRIDRDVSPIEADSCYLYFEDFGGDHFMTMVSKAPASCTPGRKLCTTGAGYYIHQSFDHLRFHRNFARAGKNAWVVSFGKHCYHIKNDMIVSEREFDEEVLSLMADDQRRLWVSKKYGRGVYVFEGNWLKNNARHLLDGYTITSMAQDREGNFWMGTEGHGVFYSSCIDFNMFTLPGDDRRLNVMDIAITGNRIWFSSQDKALYTGKLGNGLAGDLRKVKIEGVYDRIRSIAVDEDGYLWLSSTEHIRYDPAGFPRPPDTVITTTIVQKGLGDTILLASKVWGLCIYKDGQLRSFTKTDSTRRVYAIWHDRDKSIWLGTLYGLYRYSGGVEHYFGNSSPLLGERIGAVCRLGELMVVGTSAYGVLFLHGDSVLDHLAMDEGLIGNSVRAMFAQNDTVLWIGTRDGLNRIKFDHTYTRYELEGYGVSDGLPSREINSIGMHDGYIWLGTGNGLISFDPLKLKPHLAPPMIRIEGVQINGRDTTLSDHYVLAHDQNNIRVNFMGISYRAREGVRYRYMLSNYHDHMVQTNNPWANLLNLPPGDYTLYVNAGSVHGIWNENPVMIRFTIRKHYTQTVGFMILLIFLFAVSFAGIFLFFRRQRMIKERNTLELAKTEQRMFRLQMNPHFVFNALLAIQGYMYNNQPHEAGRYLTSFAKLIRHTLYGSTEDFIHLDKEIEALEYYLDLQRMRFNRMFEYSIEISDEIIPESTLIPPLLIQPFLENAIEHGLQHKGEGGKLRLIISGAGTIIKVVVEDNGIGRKKSQEMNKNRDKLHKSMGQDIVSKRIESLNMIMTQKIQLEISDMLDDSGNAAGTRVVLLLPFRHR